MTTLQELVVAAGAEPQGDDGYTFKQGFTPKPFDIVVSVRLYDMTFSSGEAVAVTLELPDGRMLYLNVEDVRLAGDHR